MGLKIITPPTVTPISIVGLDNLKHHLQEATDVSDEDALIELLLNAAWDLAERYTWRQFLTAGYCYTLDNFQAQHPRNGRRCAILLPRPPLIAVSAVKYRNDAGTLTTMPTTDYNVLSENESGMIVPAYGLEWPDVRREPQAVTIEYTAGYGTTAAVIPPVLMHAVRLQVGSWWLNRESIADKSQHELPAATKALLESIEVRDDRLTVL